MNDLIAFWGLASLITFCAVMVITLRNPVSAAIFLVLALFFLGGVFALQRADFVAAIQVIVYAGAILVLFLFVIMLLNLDVKSLHGPKRSNFEYSVVAFAISGFAYLIHLVMNSSSQQTFLAEGILAPVDNTRDLALLLFNKYIWPFELVSMLILLAIVASILIAKKKKTEMPKS